MVPTVIRGFLGDESRPLDNIDWFFGLFNDNVSTTKFK
jgi:hypothetical protein